MSTNLNTEINNLMHDIDVAVKDVKILLSKGVPRKISKDLERVPLELHLIKDTIKEFRLRCV